MIPKLILGIAGGSCSGKTLVSKRIVESVGKERCRIINQDNYYRDLKELTLEERSRWNFDRPEAFDRDLLVEHINQLKQGNSIKMPVYSFVDHTRTTDTIPIDVTELIIIEGILVLQEKRIRDLLDFRTFVDEEADIRLARRLKRDEIERGRSAQSILLQYLETVRPAHREFIEPSKEYADIIIPRGGENRPAIEILANHVKARIGIS